MAKNKVKATVAYRKGCYTAYLIADDSVEVGIAYKCKVLSGYLTTCVIKEIVAYDVDSDIASKHGKVIVDNEPIENKEELFMSSELFEIAIIEGTKGNRIACKLTAPNALIDDTVVYEGNDEKLQVGKVLHIISKGMKPTAPVAKGGFVVQVLDMRAVEEAREKETLYIATLMQLNERKKLMEERAIWAMLAEKDDEAKKLLKTLDDIRGGSNGKGNS